MNNKIIREALEKALKWDYENGYAIGGLLRELLIQAYRQAVAHPDPVRLTAPDFFEIAQKYKITSALAEAIIKDAMGRKRGGV